MIPFSVCLIPNKKSYLGCLKRIVPNHFQASHITRQRKKSLPERNFPENEISAFFTLFKKKVKKFPFFFASPKIKSSINQSIYIINDKKKTNNFLQFNQNLVFFLKKKCSKTSSSLQELWIDQAYWLIDWFSLCLTYIVYIFLV